MNHPNRTSTDLVDGEPTRVTRTRGLLGVAAALFAVVALLPACSSDIGSGNSKTVSRVVDPFTRIQIVGDIQVHVQVGQPQEVLVTGDDNLLDAYDTVVEDGTLQVRATAKVWYKVEPIVEIRVPSLIGLNSSATQDIVVQDLEAELLVVWLDGPADVVLQGRADRLVITQDQRGDVWAGDLKSREVDCRLDGTGSATVSASEVFEAVVVGPGHIDVHGAPATRDVELLGHGYVTFR